VQQFALAGVDAGADLDNECLGVVQLISLGSAVAAGPVLMAAPHMAAAITAPAQ
jgi:hypothetical protein